MATGEHDLPMQFNYKKYGNLNGVVNFYEMNGKLANGWVYSNGRTVMSTQAKRSAETKLDLVDRGRNTPPDGFVNCGTMLIAHSKTVCAEVGGVVGWGYDGSGGSGIICKTETNFVTEAMYCPNNNGDDGGYSGGGGAGVDGELVSIGENRFKMKAEDQQKYPRFTQMVKELSSFVKNDAKVLAALKKWSGFTEAQILEKVKFGQGPEIVIKELNDSDLYGYFDRFGNTNAVTINSSWVRGLEQANLIGTQQGTGFVLAVTILHEFVHLGRNENSLDADSWEYGYGFEQSSFGTFITRDNAGKYSYRFYKK